MDCFSWLTKGTKKKDEGGWTKISASKRDFHLKKWDAAFSVSKTGGKSKSTFFLTEFNEELRARDLHHQFKSYGDLDKVIIAARRDRRGRRYKFIRLFNVTNERLLATKLDNTFINGRRFILTSPYSTTT